MSSGESAEIVRDDLAKIPEILRNLNVALQEVRRENDRIRAEKIISWIDEQIAVARSLGAGRRQIRQLEEARNSFRDFLNKPNNSLVEAPRESLRNLHAEVIQEILTKLNVAWGEVSRERDYERAGKIVIFIDEQIGIIGALDGEDYSQELANLHTYRDKFYNLKPQPLSQSLPSPLLRRSNEQISDAPEFLKPAIERLREFGLREDEQGIVVDGPTQKLYLVRGNGEMVRAYPVSTGKNGFSIRDGSKATAPGMHVIYRKRGDGLPPGATMGGGRVDIYTDPQKPPAHARVITRAMYLKGREGQGTEERSIAIHGTNHEGSVLYPEERDGVLRGQSTGCIRMLNEDVIDLFNRVDENTLVEIEPRNA